MATAVGAGVTTEINGFCVGSAVGTGVAVAVGTGAAVALLEELELLEGFFVGLAVAEGFFVGLGVLVGFGVGSM